ncbi:MAG TPA: LysR family transcriptional regulator substrate-binding protein [Actinospica sp.]|nr:LysR family transcriptional regulator substrate-binding protein [Actinospica sp.]
MIPEDSITVTTGATSVRHFMSEAVVEFRSRNPRAGLRFLTASSSRDCLAAVRKQEADLAWVTIADPAEEGLELRPAANLPWMLAMRVGELYADRAWVEVSELSGLPLIRPSEDSVSGARLGAALAEVTPGADRGSADWESALLLAELGVGHAAVPRLPGPPPAGPLHLVPLRGIAPLRVGWAARSWAALSPAARSFAETVGRNARLRAWSTVTSAI